MADAAPGWILAEAGVALAAWLLAAWLRPWRYLPPQGPYGVWMAQWAFLPLAWGIDRWAGVPPGVSMSGASLFVLMVGWPLAVLTLPVAAAVMAVGGVPLADCVHRLLWLGVVPATAALLVGAAVRRWLPRHPMVFIFGRTYFGTFISAVPAGLAGGALAALATGHPDVPWVAHVLAGFAESFLTGMICAIAVAYRPHWLATWSDRLYLPPP